MLRVTHAYMQEIHALDLYCGMGGLSYIDKEEGNIKIHTKWAVDNTLSMAEAFKANYPFTHVNCWVAMSRACFELHVCTASACASNRYRVCLSSSACPSCRCPTVVWRSFFGSASSFRSSTQTSLTLQPCPQQLEATRLLRQC